MIAVHSTGLLVILRSNCATEGSMTSQLWNMILRLCMVNILAIYASLKSSHQATIASYGLLSNSIQHPHTSPQTQAQPHPALHFQPRARNLTTADFHRCAFSETNQCYRRHGIPTVDAMVPLPLEMSTAQLPGDAVVNSAVTQLGIGGSHLQRTWQLGIPWCTATGNKINKYHG